MSMIQVVQAKLAAGKFSCRELTCAYLDAISRDNGALNAYVRTTPDIALEAADRVDRKLARGEALLPLEGVPMTLKDNISTRGVETTCCSRMLQGYVPIYSAFVWEVLQKQGAVLLGKTNMDEFAMGSSSETSCFGGSLNPHDLSRVAGGSSGGAASAVAGNLAVYGLGSDTGGSIRQPASFCGVTGLKPSYGAVSRFGLVAYASSLDQIGPIAPSAGDCAAIYDVISEYDPMDSTCRGRREAALPRLEEGIRGMKIGMPEEYFSGVRPEVLSALESAGEVFRSLGAELVPFRLPALQYALPVYYILACAEAASNLGRYDGIRYGYRTAHYSGVHDMVCRTRTEGFGKEVQRRILLGNYVLSSGYYDAYYKKAQGLRGAIVKGFREAFEKCDIIMAPTVPMTAFPQNFTGADPVETYLTDICTVPVNIAGLPALSTPCGYDSGGLPIGMQLIGNTFCEASILTAAHQYEKAAGQHKATKWGVTL